MWNGFVVSYKFYLKYLKKKKTQHEHQNNRKNSDKGYPKRAIN